MGVPASAPEADAASEIEPTAEAILAATPDAPPADFLRFAQMGAREMHSRVDPASIRRVPEAPEQASLDSFMAMAKPDALDPRRYQPRPFGPVETDGDDGAEDDDMSE
jgi:hypothetical protein